MKIKEKLPEEFKTKWLEALRSGEYLQGFSGNLKSKNSDGIYRYCCLGVAAEIAGCKIPVKEPIGFIEDVKGISKVPKILRGNSNDSPIVEKLSTMNDNELKTFKQIANYIEKNL